MAHNELNDVGEDLYLKSSSLFAEIASPPDLSLSINENMLHFLDNRNDSEFNSFNVALDIT